MFHVHQNILCGSSCSAPDSAACSNQPRTDSPDSSVHQQTPPLILSSTDSTTTTLLQLVINLLHSWSLISEVTPSNPRYVFQLPWKDQAENKTYNLYKCTTSNKQKLIRGKKAIDSSHICWIQRVKYIVPSTYKICLTEVYSTPSKDNHSEITLYLLWRKKIRKQFSMNKKQIQYNKNIILIWKYYNPVQTPFLISHDTFLPNTQSQEHSCIIIFHYTSVIAHVLSDYVVCYTLQQCNHEIAHIQSCSFIITPTVILKV